MALIDNGKGANQIARLAAILVKYSVPSIYKNLVLSNELIKVELPP